MSIFIVTVYSQSDIANQYAFDNEKCAEKKFVALANDWYGEIGIEFENIDGVYDCMATEEFMDMCFDYKIGIEEVVLEVGCE